jgi:hypothetical protein
MPRQRKQHRGKNIEITIPTMEWTQIGGDMDPGAYGGTIATGDGNAIELIKIQPVREYVGDKEAKEVGFPFWTRIAYFTIDDLSLDDDNVQSALDSIDLDNNALREMTPTQRALAIAQALLDYGRADEGPAGWSANIGIPDRVKWWSDQVAGAEYLADEDDAFRNEVLGYDDIRTALEEMIERMADQSSAAAWSTLGDQMKGDLEEAGFDSASAVGVAEFGDAIAVNGDVSDKTLASVESELERDGYELTDFGGRIPNDEAEVSTEHVVHAVTKELDRSEEDVEAAAKGLDWWGFGSSREVDVVYWSTSGYSSVWAKRKRETETNERRRLGARETPRRGPFLGPAPSNRAGTTRRRRH